MRTTLRSLAGISVLELVSLMALLANIATLRLHQFTAILGPIHGSLYLAVGVTGLFARGLALRTRLGALVPVFGGVFTLINVRAELLRLQNPTAQ